MGRAGLPLYGETDLGSAIETAEKVIAQIKTNKYDKKDLIELADTLLAIKVAIEEYEDKN